MIIQVFSTQLNYLQEIFLMNINKYLQFTKRRTWPSFDLILVGWCSRIIVFSIKLRAIKINMFIYERKPNFSELNCDRKKIY